MLVQIQLVEPIFKTKVFMPLEYIKMKNQNILVHELDSLTSQWPCSLVVKQAPDKSFSDCSIQSSATTFYSFTHFN